MNRFFELARKISFKSRYKHKIGAVIVEKNRVIGLGFNECKTHPKSPDDFSMRHAEFNSILNARQEDFSNCEIYIYRELKNGKTAPSKPCTHCREMLRSLNFAKIYYTDYDSFKKEAV